MMANTTNMSSSFNGSDVDLLYRVNQKFTTAILPVTVILAIISVVGIVGNSLIILVYSKQYDRSNFRHFVLFLAFNDLTSCMTCIPAEVFTQLNWYRLTYSWLCQIKAYFNLFTSCTSAAILLLFSFDRFRKICFPLKLQIRPSLAFKLCLGITVSTSIIIGPGVLGWSSVTYPLPTAEGDVNVNVCGKWDLLPDLFYDALFYFYIFGILAMMITITILNLMTARKVLCGKRMLPSKTGGTSVGEIRFRSFTDHLSVSNNTITEYVSTIEESNGEHGVTNRTSMSNIVATETNERESDYVHYPNIACKQKSFDEENSISSGEEALQYRQPDVLYRQPDVFYRQPDVFSKPKHAGLELGATTNSVREQKKVKSTSGGKRTQKLVIMFVLTMVFVVTMTMWVCVTAVITPKLSQNSLSDTDKVLYFLAWRMYFLNYMVNPFLYGVMDQRFRMELKRRICGR